MSAAEIFRWPVTVWTHPCGRFVPSTAGSPRWCSTCSFARHAHPPITCRECGGRFSRRAVDGNSFEACSQHAGKVAR